jgi:hypothetical protein
MKHRVRAEIIYDRVENLYIRDVAWNNPAAKVLQVLHPASGEVIYGQYIMASIAEKFSRVASDESCGSRD